MATFLNSVIENILPFTLEQKDYLKNRLLKYSYFIENEKGDNILFGFEDDKSVSALLTNNCLSFSATGEGIFEISMTSSEFTDNEEFKKFDPQNGGWEEI